MNPHRSRYQSRCQEFCFHCCQHLQGPNWTDYFSVGLVLHQAYTWYQQWYQLWYWRPDQTSLVPLLFADPWPNTRLPQVGRSKGNGERANQSSIRVLITVFTLDSRKLVKFYFLFIFRGKNHSKLKNFWFVGLKIVKQQTCSPPCFPMVPKV